MTSILTRNSGATVTPQPVPDRLVDETEAADILTVKKQTMSVWRLRGCGPRFVKIGKCVRYRLSDLHAYIDCRTVSNTAQADALPD